MVFVALLYLAGRSFATGYFSAMNIPSYQVTFSLWEYGEATWVPMLIYAAAILGVDGLVGGFVWTLLGWWIIPQLNRFDGWLRKLIREHLPAWKLPETFSPAQTRPTVSIVLGSTQP